MSDLDDFDLNETRERKDDLLGEAEGEAPSIVPERRGSLGIVLSSTALVAALAAAVLLVFRGPRRVAVARGARGEQQDRCEKPPPHIVSRPTASPAAGTAL